MQPILIALIDDYYDIVLTGIARMLDPYRNRVLVAEINANQQVDTVEASGLLRATGVGSDQVKVCAARTPTRVVVYTWNFPIPT